MGREDTNIGDASLVVAIKARRQRVFQTLGAYGLQHLYQEVPACRSQFTLP